MSQTLMKSTILITVATFLSKLLGSLLQIPLQNIAGDEVAGIFRLVYPVYMIALILSVAGIPIAISKLISEARAEGDEKKVDELFQTATRIALGFGFVSFLLMVIFSKSIALSLGGSFTRLAIVVVSVTLLFAPYMAVYRGFFQGFENMKPTAYSQVLEQFVRLVLTIAIAYYLVGEANNQTIAGWIMFGSIAGVLASLLYLRITFKKLHRIRYRLQQGHFKQLTKTILSLSLPIAVGALTMALLNLVDSLTIPHALRRYGLDNKAIQYAFGLYSGRGASLVQMTVVFSSAIILPLIPLISKTMVTKNWEQTNEYIRRSLKLAHLVSWPAAIGLFIIAEPVNLALFKNVSGTNVIAVLGISSFFMSFTVLTTGILQGLNQSKQVAWLLVITTLLKGLLNFVLIHKWGIIGAAWATVIVYALLMLIHLLWIKKVTAYKESLRSSFLIASASLLIGFIMYLSLNRFAIEEWSRLDSLIYLLIMLPCSIIIYSGFIYLFRVFSEGEWKSIPGVNRLLQKRNRG